MKLLTEEIKARIPKLRSTRNTPDPIVQVKLFTPDSNWTWYIIEGGVEMFGPYEEYMLYGYVEGLEGEWGYVMLSELEDARGPFGLKIERDLYFEPVPFSQVRPLLRTDPSIYEPSVPEDWNDEI